MSDPAPAIPVFITLGSNIEPEQNLRRAVRMLAQNHHLTLCAVSRVYQTAPVGADGAIVLNQPLFLNAAVLVETDYYSAFRLKYDVLRFIETCLGRVRGADKFAPRPIDLDIALYDNRIIAQPHLIVPDPNIARYAHLALPLADLAPDFRHPLTGQTLRALAAPFVGKASLSVRADVDLRA